jgi:hypothetical protein
MSQLVTTTTFRTLTILVPIILIELSLNIIQQFNIAPSIRVLISLGVFVVAVVSAVFIFKLTQKTKKTP